MISVKQPQARTGIRAMQMHSSRQAAQAYVGLTVHSELWLHTRSAGKATRQLMRVATGSMLLEQLLASLPCFVKLSWPAKVSSAVVSRV